MKRFRNVVILLFAFALIVAACSSDDDGGSEDTTTTEAGTDTTEAMVDLAGTSVTLFGPESSENEAGAMQDALDVFAEANGMTITYTGARDFSDQINAQAAGGNPPDIAVFPQPGKVIDFGTQGFILPIPADLVEFSCGPVAWWNARDRDCSRSGLGTPEQDRPEVRRVVQHLDLRGRWL